MDQRISLVTLGVSDLARARTFYERLGWRGQEVEETVFFQAGGIAIVLWSADKLAADAGLPKRALPAANVSYSSTPPGCSASRSAGNSGRCR